jgi:hypothetical protein
MDYFLKKATDSRRQFGSDGNENPNYGREPVGFFSLKNQPLTRYWPLDWRDYFEQGMKWHAPLSLDFGLDLWRLHTIAVQVQRPWEFMAKGLDFGHGLWKLHTLPSRRLHSLYFIGYVFSTHFFGLSTKFGHSIPRPLNLDGHSVKRPLLNLIYLKIPTNDAQKSPRTLEMAACSLRIHHI